MKNKDAHAGLKIGSLTLIKPIRIKNNNNNHTRAGWICQCDCGSKIKVRTDQLGIEPHKTRSCGCWNRKHNLASSHNKLHQKYKTSDSQPESKYHRLYQLWTKIKRRCYDPKTKEFKYYGSRGIQMCESWKNNYPAFKKWSLNNGYNLNKDRKYQTIDRINVNEGYTPSNCRWVSMTTQANNKTNTVYIKFYGTKTTLGNLSRKYGIKYQTLVLRHKKAKDKNFNLVRPPYKKRLNQNLKTYKKDDEICFIF